MRRGEKWIRERAKWMARERVFPGCSKIAHSNGSIPPRFHISRGGPFSPPVAFVIRVAEWCFTSVHTDVYRHPNERFPRDGNLVL